MPLFLTLGLGSTLISRMVLNLRGWNRVVTELSHNSVHVVGNNQSRGTAYRDAQVILAGFDVGDPSAGGSKSRRNTMSDPMSSGWRTSADEDLEGAVELELDVIGKWFGWT